MPNGDTEGQARAERLMIRYRQNARGRDNGLAAMAERSLPPYRAEMESEDSTVTGPGGITAKLPIPRAGRMAIGFGLGVLFICVGIAIVLYAVR